MALALAESARLMRWSVSPRSLRCARNGQPTVFLQSACSKRSCRWMRRCVPCCSGTR